MQRATLQKLAHGVLTGLIAAAVAVVLAGAGGLDWLENHSWDWRVRLTAKPSPATGDIVLIFLDQGSLNWARQQNQMPWPWPREAYAAILGFCRRAGTKSVAFDLLFSEPSRWGVADDVAFGAAIAKTPGFVAAGAFGNEPARPIPDVATNAAVIASVSTTASDDAVIRCVLPGRVSDGHFYPSLGLGAWVAAHPGATMPTIPLNKHDEVILRYRGPTQTHHVVSAQSVIQSEIQIQEGKKPVLDPSALKNKYVFFGVTAPGLFDLKASPTSKIYPGVEAHATFLDNLLANDFVRPCPAWLNALFAFAFALGAALVNRFAATGVRSGVAFAGFLVAPFLVTLGACHAGYWLEAAPATVAVTFALIATGILNYAFEGRQKRLIKGAFKQYLSPTVIEQLVRNPERLRLGGESRELSIFFSDVQGFTSLSEKLTPEELTALLNDYLTAMSDIIMEQGGTVDKYEGDAIIAFWNAPLDLPGHAEAAVRSALLCQQKLAELRPGFRERCGRDLFTRIGINTGTVVIGNMGSRQRFNYTFLGDAGNLASRLEGVNKQFGTFILISEFTRAKLGTGIACRELGRVRVVGRQTPITVYEPMTPEMFAERKTTLETFDAGLRDWYRGDIAEAAAKFAQIAAEDAPARAYQRRCAALTGPRPDPWDGVWQMTEK